MSLLTRIGLVVLLLLAFEKNFAQGLEFVENKGQWDAKVKFKTDVGGNVFFLQPQGYKVLLNNADDLDSVAAFYSGHFHNGKGITKKKEDGDVGNLTSAVPTQKQVVLHSFAYEVSFVGASNAAILPDKPLPTYNNYFLGNDKTKWASGCKIYQGVTYQNIYPGIDIRYYTGTGNVKYDFIVHPNADISKIALKFDGQNGLALKNGNLIIKTSVGDVTELKPYCYQVDGKGRSDVDAKFVLDGNIVKFKLGSYSKTATVIIDPTLIFASFTGSATDNWGYTATYDGAGNFYGGGIAFGQGYPVSSGAYQTLFGGGTDEDRLSGFDVAIIKLNAGGTQRLYGTYLGGGGNEQPHSLIVDNSGNLIIAGRTNSSGSFPITAPTFGAGGGYDIFISKISADGGALLASRKFGGVSADGVNIQSKEIAGPKSITRNYGDDARSEVIVDKNDNIYLASCTQSTTVSNGKFPTTASAFQTTSGSAQDGVVIKATGDLTSVLFSSFIGGSGDDAAFSLGINPITGNLYVAGSTTSTDLKGTGGSPGPILFSSFQGGICDGFVSMISNDGSNLIKTVYVGTKGDDMTYGIQFDKKGFPYITGTTTVAFPLVGNPAFTSQSNGKQYITKMKTDLSGIVYSTNFGKGQGNPDISPTAFLVDRCENVYVAGWGGGLDVNEAYPNEGTLGLKTTPNAIRATSDGSDFYFFVLEKNALSQLYGTFYGNVDNTPDVGDHVDGGTSRYNSEGVIYEALCANCFHVGSFATQGQGGPPWAPNNGAAAGAGAECNEAMLKIGFEFAGVGSGIRSAINGVPRDTSGCIPLTVDFNDTIANGKIFIWHFGDGSSDTTTTVAAVAHTFNSLGTFRVRLVSIDSSTCNIADTSYLNIRVRDDRADLSFTLTKLPPCDSLKYQFANTSTPPAGKPFGPQSFQWSFGDGITLITGTQTVTHSFPASGVYNVSLRLIDTNYCNNPDSSVVQLRIAANVKAQFVTAPYGCAPYNAVFTNTSLAGQQFTWDFGDGTTSTVESPVHLYSTPGTYTIKLVAVDTSTCNKIDSTQQTIIVSASPTAAFVYSPQEAKENQIYTFTNQSVGGVLYKWLFGDGDSVVTANHDTLVTHIYNVTGTYNACLVTFNQYGCSDTACQAISAIIVPLVDVPNAFTPNGDGINDFVKVRGFGITKMDWRIYNRWGALVFQSVSQNIGWDGKYKGQLQPQEVYVYVLDVTFSDGTKYRKKGDITLLR